MGRVLAQDGVKVFEISRAVDDLSQIRREVGLGYRSLENIRPWPACLEYRWNGHGFRSCAFYLFIRAHRTGLVSSLPASCLHDFVVCSRSHRSPQGSARASSRESRSSRVWRFRFSPTSAGSRFRLPSRFQTRRGPGAPVLSSFVFLDTTRRATGRRRPLRADVCNAAKTGRRTTRPERED